MNPQITVLGAAGFIGSALVQRLERAGVPYFAPRKNEPLAGRQLGNAIYCIGLTADFRSFPFETVEAHVCHLQRLLRECDFESLTYLSSARVYQNHDKPAHEDDPIRITPGCRDELYNVSKLMGEALALASGKTTRIVRLSNVYGADFTSQNFLPALIGEAITRGRMIIRSAPEAKRDYISLADVVDVLPRLALGASQSIYNLASGTNVSNQVLTSKIAELTGCEIIFDPVAASTSFPLLNIDRISSEFEFRPRSVLDDLAAVVQVYREHFRKPKNFN